MKCFTEARVNTVITYIFLDNIYNAQISLITHTSNNTFYNKNICFLDNGINIASKRHLYIFNVCYSLLIHFS